VLGAIDDQAPAATVMVGHDGHRGWVYYLAVERSQRHRGLGRRMMEHAEAWLRARGAVKLNLMIRHTNAPALGFYQRLGYEDDDVTSRQPLAGGARVGPTPRTSDSGSGNGCSATNPCARNSCGTHVTAQSVQVR